jgi:ATP-binding cassette subfamily C protein PrsD
MRIASFKIVAKAGDEVVSALLSCRRAFVGVAVFSGCVNVLSLTGSLYMLQISDRVMTSRSIPTLIALSLLVCAAYVLQGILDGLRCRMLSRIGAKFSEALVGRVHSAVTALSLKRMHPSLMSQAIRDLDQVQKFLSGPGPTAAFDIPFMPLFFVVAYMMHPLFGWLILFGGLSIVGFTALVELRTHAPRAALTVSATARHAIADSSFRNAEVLIGMGMSPVFAGTFASVNARYVGDNLNVSEASNGIRALAKVFRAMLQSGVLGLGAYLAINGEISAGAMIAASILTARALAPVEISVANWQGLVAARQGLLRLRSLLGEVAMPEQRTVLPDPAQSVAVEGVYVTVPGQSKPIVQNVTFKLKSGQGLAIIGPSASGKSSLARALIGVWPAARGRVMLDGASIEHWDKASLGRHIGYLPQDIELFDGSVAENIARFDKEADSTDIVQAACDAGAHEMILRLPQGYQSIIGESGATLSAGQRQRIALARALFRKPFLLVLDEPNSNLDSEGEDALVNAIIAVRRRGGIAVVVTHRPTALAGVDMVAVMIEGRLQAFGERDAIMARMTKQGQKRQAVSDRVEEHNESADAGGVHAAAHTEA